MQPVTSLSLSTFIRIMNRYMDYTTHKQKCEFPEDIAAQEFFLMQYAHGAIGFNVLSPPAGYLMPLMTHTTQKLRRTYRVGWHFPGFVDVCASLHCIGVWGTSVKYLDLQHDNAKMTMS